MLVGLGGISRQCQPPGQGPAGPAGPAGAPGPAGVSLNATIERRIETGIVSSAFVNRLVVAECRRGVVISGGCDALFGFAAESSFFPPEIAKNTARGNGWACLFRGGTSINMPVATTVLCLVQRLLAARSAGRAKSAAPNAASPLSGSSIGTPSVRARIAVQARFAAPPPTVRRLRKRGAPSSASRA